MEYGDNWEEDEHEDDSWTLDDPNMPGTGCINTCKNYEVVNAEIINGR